MFCRTMGLYGKGYKMDKQSSCYKAYVAILEEELKPAMGCTEPIALAYAAATCRDLLGGMPKDILVEASGSIIKNVKSVFVPNTGHLKGIPAAISAGIVAGDASKELEVLAGVSDEAISRIRTYMETAPIRVEHVDAGHVFDIIITMKNDEGCAKVRIVDYHTNIILKMKNEKVIFEKDEFADAHEEGADRSLLSMDGIWDFAHSVDLSDVREVIGRQIDYNMAIAKEGLTNDYGACVGKVLYEMAPTDMRIQAKAYAAAGSDARMNGCDLPVVINSGSGNQGITTSVPVIIYSRALDVDQDTLYRALVLANLTTIHEKTPIGSLSAYCGATSAGAGAAAGIAYLCGASFEEVVGTVINSIATVSGMVCDGAKASCASKIASAIEAGLLGYDMAKRGIVFEDGDGIVSAGVESTIKNVGRLAKDGMDKTNDEIIDIMIHGGCQ